MTAELTVDRVFDETIVEVRFGSHHERLRAEPEPAWVVCAWAWMPDLLGDDPWSTRGRYRPATILVFKADEWRCRPKPDELLFVREDLTSVTFDWQHVEAWAITDESMRLMERP